MKQNEEDDYVKTLEWMLKTDREQGIEYRESAKESDEPDSIDKILD